MQNVHTHVFIMYLHRTVVLMNDTEIYFSKTYGNTICNNICKNLSTNVYVCTR